MAANEWRTSKVDCSIQKAAPMPHNYLAPFGIETRANQRAPPSAGSAAAEQPLPSKSWPAWKSFELITVQRSRWPLGLHEIPRSADSGAEDAGSSRGKTENILQVLLLPLGHCLQVILNGICPPGVLVPRSKHAGPRRYLFLYSPPYFIVLVCC